MNRALTPLILIIAGIIPLTSLAIPLQTLPEPVSKKAQPVYENLYQQGLLALQKGDTGQAKTLFEKSLENYPDYVPARLGLVHVHFEHNEKKQAERMLSQLHEDSPNDLHVGLTWARYQLSERNVGAAVNQYQSLLDSHPEATKPRIDLADIYMARGESRRPEAIRLYREVIELDPDHSGAHYALAVALESSGELSEARQLYAKAAKLAPQNPLPRIAEGRLLLKSGQPAEARESLEDALRRHPESLDARVALAELEMASGNHEAAITAYKQAFETNPSPPILLKLAMAYSMADDWENARKSYSQLVELDNTNALAFNNLAWSLAKHEKNYELAWKYAKRATELAPATPAYQATLGWILLEQNKPDQAEQVLNRALELNPEYQPTLVHLGRAKAAQFKPAEARTLLRKAIEVDPASASAADARSILEKL